MRGALAGGVVAILRGRRAEQLDAVLGVLVDAGIRSLEITLNTPGALTPTEIVAAWASGATAVKLFPARLGGPGYLRDIREPLPDIPIVPTGGVSAENVPDWFAAGAAAVGVGGTLIGDALDGGDLSALAARAAELIRRTSTVTQVL